jgi:hypothetical protein
MNMKPVIQMELCLTLNLNLVFDQPDIVDPQKNKYCNSL